MRSHSFVFPMLSLALGVAACSSAGDSPSASSEALLETRATPAPGADAAPATVDDDGPEPSTFKRTTATEHFDVYWNDSETTAAELASVLAAAEDSYERLDTFLGCDRMPGSRLVIQLEGDGQTPDHRFNFPHVGARGHIHLYRFPGTGGEYQAQMTHEMVHAFRAVSGLAAEHEADWATGFGFVEEAFAEFAARAVQPTQSGFPLYGTPVGVAAAAYITTGQDIPMTALMERHELNLRCLIQAYPLRASFFQYLAERFGKDRLFAFAYSHTPVTAASYLEAFDESPQALTTAWRAWELEAFAKVPDGAKAVDAYLNDTPGKFFPKCTAGKDF